LTEIEDTEFGRELIASMQEAVAIVRGEKDAARVHLPPGDFDVRALRERLGLTRAAFSKRFGLAVAAVRDWEQGLRRPDPAARVLLLVIARSPETVAEVVAEVRAASNPPYGTGTTTDLIEEMR
jgi:putative transcriptional regulator